MIATIREHEECGTVWVLRLKRCPGEGIDIGTLNTEEQAEAVRDAINAVLPCAGNVTWSTIGPVISRAIMAGDAIKRIGSV